MDYEASVALIKEVEGVDKERRSVIVDLVDLGSEIDVTEYTERDIPKIIDYVDAITGGTAAAEAVQKTEGAQQDNAAKPQPLPTAAQSYEKASETVKAAAAELGKAVARVQKTMPVAKEKSAPPEDEGLVMVNLSLNDQISELEKIDRGLDIGAFDNEQTGIIKKEVNGLVKKKYVPTDKYQEGLLELRDRRLKEVIRKLGM
ncbi:MAG: hypothetical protein KGH64_01645 [Candidatus Micrarchaeota archaeon]|nr:hypothetical protein [Candidatus Micrarchaeota archaeon]MDE1834020.1 hypothetical protein [Candidatus Micrarchaeota archaeon]MDE1859378.1 hypothetical protein [Candidatus Micrarchaeota archaeon]